MDVGARSCELVTELKDVAARPWRCSGAMAVDREVAYVGGWFSTGKHFVWPRLWREPVRGPYRCILRVGTEMGVCWVRVRDSYTDGGVRHAQKTGFRFRCFVGQRSLHGGRGASILVYR